MKSDPEDFDVIENATQFAQIVAVSALVGTADILRAIRKRIE